MIKEAKVFCKVVYFFKKRFVRIKSETKAIRLYLTFYNLLFFLPFSSSRDLNRGCDMLILIEKLKSWL